MKKSFLLSAFLSLLTLAFASVAVAQAFPVTPSQAFVGLLAVSAITPQFQGVLLATPVATEVAAIAKFAGMHSKTLLSQMLNGMDLFRDNKVDRNVSRFGKLLPKVVFEAGVRPLDTNITRNGATERTISGRKLLVHDQMKLFYYEPDEVRESFLSDMLVPGAKQIPLAQWFWQKELEKLASELNDTAYNQVYEADAAAFSAAATYTVGAYVKFTDGHFYRCVTNTSAGESPTTAAAKWSKVTHLVSFDGFGTIIAAEIAGSAITPITTGAISNSNALDKIELMYNAMSVPHRIAGGIVKVSPDVFRKYVEDKRSTYANTATEDIGDGEHYVFGTGKKWKIKECTWMGTSQRVIFDVKNENLVVGTNLAGNAGVTKTVETLHGTESVAKWFMGCQIADLETLYVNDQA